MKDNFFLVRYVVACGEFVLITCCRTQLKGHFLMSLETVEGFLDAMGTQGLADGSYQSPEEMSKNIDNVSLSDIANVRPMITAQNRTSQFIKNINFLYLIAGCQDIYVWEEGHGI